ncbi:MAG TPA: NADH-quinone oxidoreductase subunit NuoF [Candidatus Megaira endosymbiont of Hartmannula sinica]|nr:NADH-quinone oxidoreductase subunit NuoF [Candidatus Megaera endosymbiont of Hartmannula sinica]
MLDNSKKIFQNIIYKQEVGINSAKTRGAWQTYKDSIKLAPNNIIEEVKKSGLRGRGGAGFSTGMKWSFMPSTEPINKEDQRYLVINADESEPGTCKDRDIIRYEPHKILEGILISCHAIRASICYIYIRGEFVNEAKILQKAIDEAYADKLFGADSPTKIEVYLHRGAGAYICGEETALLESLEGNKGQPRLKPPFPANQGLYNKPTTINNVESIAVIPFIIKYGAEKFASFGPTRNSGTKLFCISGDVNNPCVIEEEMGIKMKDLIENYAGGVIGGWNNLKAVIPGGSSTPLLPKEICDEVAMDFDSLKNNGSALGTGGIIVMNKQTDIIYAIARISKFYMHESCGQCTPCREGTGWMYRMMMNIVNKKATAEDIDRLLTITHQIEGNTICALADAAAWPIQGLIRHFKNEMIERIQQNL